jgi:UDP-N-acetylmuramoyl-tripeptide--D-alanyl-D-alanine ligase
MTVAFSPEDALNWARGRWVSGSEKSPFLGVGIDARSIAPGQLFLAIRGERHDAHKFIGDALARGATGLVVEESWLSENSPPAGPCTLAVTDSTQALGALAKGHRDRFSGPVVAVTGSNGKTTTKELIHSILSVSGPCLKNHGNLNNEFGLPLTLLARQEEDLKAVVELGMNHRGEIARLAAIARPDVGVITNVGSAHIEFLGSREEIANEKGDLIPGLANEGVAVLNHDDPGVMSQAHRVTGRLRTFGLEAGADVRAEDVRTEPGGYYAFRLVAPEGSVLIRVPGLADTTVINALAASTASLAAGADLDEIARGLARFGGVPGRMVGRAMPGGGHLVDDTYNANPQSMRSAMENLVRLGVDGRCMAILGDMGELGDASEESHRSLGRLAAQLGIDQLFLLGENARWVAEEALAGGMSQSAIQIDMERTTLAQSVLEVVQPGDWVLVKGSRAMHMERLVDILTAEERN